MKYALAKCYSFRCAKKKKVTGMPRIETEFEFGIVVCFFISLAPYAVFFFFFFFSFRFTLNTLHVESDHPINTMFVCLSVRPSFRSQFVNIESYLELQPFGID